MGVFVIITVTMIIVTYQQKMMMIIMGVFVIITVTMIMTNPLTQQSSSRLPKRTSGSANITKPSTWTWKWLTSQPFDICYNYDCHGPWWHDHIIMIMIPSSTVPWRHFWWSSDDLSKTPIPTGRDPTQPPWAIVTITIIVTVTTIFTAKITGITIIHHYHYPHHHHHLHHWNPPPFHLQPLQHFCFWEREGVADGKIWFVRYMKYRNRKNLHRKQKESWITIPEISLAVKTWL